MASDGNIIASGVMNTPDVESRLVIYTGGEEFGPEGEYVIPVHEVTERNAMIDAVTIEGSVIVTAETQFGPSFGVDNPGHEYKLRLFRWSQGILSFDGELVVSGPVYDMALSNNVLAVAAGDAGVYLYSVE
jgi:hypothetical protein